MSLFDGYAVTQEIKTVMKIYPGLIRLDKYIEPFIVRRHDYDPYNPNKVKRKRISISDEDSDKTSLRRAKTTIRDITLCNEFDLFVTFTFKNNRTNVDAKKRQMAFWLNNQRNLHGNFKYIIVAEYHKDGRAIHFHALFKDYRGQIVPAINKKTGKEILQNGRQVLNIKSYKGGYSTAVWIDDLSKVSSYVTKYITKDMPKFKGKQRYWCSNGLKRPLKIINPLLSEEDERLFTLSFTDKQKQIFEAKIELSDADILRIADYDRLKFHEEDLRIEEW